MDYQTLPPVPPPMSTEASPAKPKKSKKLITFLLVLCAAAAGFAAAYYWQASGNDETSLRLSSAEAQITSLEQQLASEKKESENAAQEPAQSPSTPVSSKPDLLPGNVDQYRTDGKTIIEPIFKISINPTALWVEYGTSPDKLDKSTNKITTGFGMAGAGHEYATGFAVSIDNSELKPGTPYFYRTAATIDGKTQQSAIATFTSNK